jgi:hypothetical protein
MTAPLCRRRIFSCIFRREFKRVPETQSLIELQVSLLSLDFGNSQLPKSVVNLLSLNQYSPACPRLKRETRSFPPQDKCQREVQIHPSEQMIDGTHESMVKDTSDEIVDEIFGQVELGSARV